MSSFASDTIYILHVDDDPDVADTAAAFLERENSRFTVETAASATAGLEQFGEEIDCIVSDYDMPSKNGIEFLEMVRAECPDVPFILYTGKGSEEVASDAISAGVTDYLQKETGSDQYTVLANRIENAVRQTRSQEALEESQQRLSLFFEQSPLGVIEWDENFDVVQVNDTATEILGYTEAELEGESWESIVVEADKEQVEDVVERLLDAEGGYHSINQNCRKDGSTVTCEWHNRVITDDEGETLSILSQFQDITERKEHERELKVRAKAMEAVTDGLAILDENQEYAYMNDAHAEMYGYDSPKELLGDTWRACYDDVDTSRFEAEILPELFETGEWRGEMAVTTADGREIVQDLLLNVTSKERVVCVVRDITDRKEHEARLEQSTARLEALFEHSPDMIDIHTGDGTIVDVNQPFCEAFDQPEAALVGRKVWDIDQQLNRDKLLEMWDTMEIGDRIEIETEYKIGDKTAFPAEVHVTRLPVEDGNRFMVISRDITERKNRLQEIQALKERLELAVEGANLGVWDWDMRTDAVEFNEQWATMLGHTLDDIEPHLDAWKRRLHPDDRESVKAAITAHRNAETPYYDTEHRLRTADDGWKWIRDLGRIVERNEDNEPVRAVGIHLDIDDRKTRERELERTHDLLEQTEHIADVGGWQIDPETQEVFWSDHLFELLGREPGEEPPLAEALDVYHEEDRPAVEAAVEKALSTGNAFDVNARFHRADDELRWFRIQGEPTIAEGEVVSLRGAVQDITQQRARESQLQQSRKDYEALFNGMHDSAWVIGFDETFRAVNDAAVKQSGYTREALLSMGPHDIDAGLEGDEISRLLRDLPEDEVQVVETVHETKTGREIPVEISSTLITYHNERAILSVARDISERKQREEQLEEFASIVSHDLRNPLSVAQGSLELVQEECESDHLERITAAHDRMDQLIQHLLTLANEGSEIGDQESINLGAFVERCWQTVATGAGSLRSEIDMTIEGDPSRLQQFFENLMRNAVKHGGEDVTVTVGPLSDGFYIEDNGPGIPVEHRDDVFDYGYSTIEGGTGFGLSIVKQIADGHDWNIRITEGKEGGARFEITEVGSGDEDIRNEESDEHDRH